MRGEAAQETVYGDDPVAFARRWAEWGAPWLHVVDLDGAFTGTPAHTETVFRIARTVSVPVQTGGGIRSLEAVERYLAGGVRRVVLGTKAFLEEDFVVRALRFHGDRIAVGVDIKEGRVAVEGWVRKEWADPDHFIDRLLNDGVRTIVVTDVSRDGTLSGPLTERLEKILARTRGRASVIASGGIGSLEDLEGLSRLEPAGLTGAIVGRALYDGKLDLREAIRRCSPKGSSPASTSRTGGSSKGSGFSS